MEAVAQGSVSANGIDFAFLSAGTPGAPLALCLHGFPDSAHTWRYLLPELADAGYHAVAPFQRGYAPTSVPADGCHQSGTWAADANALHHAFRGADDAVIIGHDWGAAATHGAAVLAPERWAKVVSSALPPGSALGMALVGNLAQIQRSWYVFFFQHALAELVVPANDFAFIDRLWSQWSPGYDASEDLSFSKDCLRDPANLSAALGIYRAALGAGRRNPEFEDAQTATQGWTTRPHLYLHGRNDGCVGVEVAESAAAIAPPNVVVEIVESAGHFLHLERQSFVNARIMEFLG